MLNRISCFVLVILFVLSNGIMFYIYQKTIQSHVIWVVSQFQDQTASFQNTSNEQSLRTVSLSQIERFKEFQRQAIDKLDLKRVVYVLPGGGGYGHKIIQIISALTIALIKDAIIVINMTEVDKYIQEPVYKSFQTGISVENELNYLFDPNATVLIPRQTHNTWRYEKNLQHLYLSLPENYERFVCDDMGAIYYELVLNPQYFIKLAGYGLVSNRSFIKARQYLDQSEPPLTPESLNTVYSVGFELASNILNTFWRPNQELQNEINKYKQLYFDKHFVIGIQLRFEFLEPEDIEVMIKCARYIERVKQSSKSVKWFLTGDNVEKLQQVKLAHEDKVFIVEELEIAHVGVTVRGYHRAVLDIELLSLADELIMTGGSSYGFLAAMRSGRLPLFVDGYRNSTRCERFTFSNPSRRPSGYSVI